MSDQRWSWALTIVGIIGFYLAGRKIWWCWYVNIANQALWLGYSLVTKQYGFLIGTFFYLFVFIKNAIAWTKEHKDHQDKRVDVGSDIEAIMAELIHRGVRFK